MSLMLSELLKCSSHAEEAEKKLNLYLDELEFWNPRYGLVNEKSRDEIIARHILDSLTLFELSGELPGAAEVADIGSGAGLPGIPLAVSRPEWQVSLVERSGKRIRFLENILFRLNLPNLFLEPVSAEKVGKKFDVITFRAFTALNNDWMAIFTGLLREGGVIASFKGRRAQAEEEWDACSRFHRQFSAYFHNVEGSGQRGERTLVLLRKLL